MEPVFEGASALQGVETSMMEDISDLECIICSNVFSDHYCPRILPCSHTFCGSCIDGIILTKNVCCPLCREKFTVTSANDLLVNRIILNVAKQFSPMYIGSNRPSKATPKKCSQARVNDVKKRRIKKAVTECQEVESQIVCVLRILDQMKAGVLITAKEFEDTDRVLKPLQEVKVSIRRALKPLQKVKVLITKNLNNIGENIEMWRKNLTAIRREKEKMQEYGAALEATGTYSSPEVMDRMEDVLQISQSKIKEFKKLLLKKERERQHFEKEMLAADTKLKSILEKVAKDMKISHQDFPKLWTKRNILEEVAKRIKVFSHGLHKPVDTSVAANIRDRPPTPHSLPAPCYDSVNGPWEWDNPEETFVIKIYKGKQRVAHAVKGDSKDQFYMSHLREGLVPPDCISIRVEPLLEKSSRRAFLDLGMDGTFIGRIVIKVMDEGNYALNFLHLCAGDLGPSYLNSGANGVVNMGMSGECLWLGEYEAEGERTVKPVMSWVNWKKEMERDIYREMPWMEGQVWGSIRTDSVSTFCIVTRGNSTWGRRNCFGVVEEGLSVVREAIMQLRVEGSLTIMDCGLIFTQ